MLFCSEIFTVFDTVSFLAGISNIQGRHNTQMLLKKILRKKKVVKWIPKTAKARNLNIIKPDLKKLS